MSHPTIEKNLEAVAIKLERALNPLFLESFRRSQAREAVEQIRLMASVVRRALGGRE